MPDIPTSPADRERYYLENICERYGCIFAQASLGMCKTKYEGGVADEFEKFGSCELAVKLVEQGDKKRGELAIPGRMTAKGFTPFDVEAVSANKSIIQAVYRYSNVGGRVKFLGKRK